MIKIYKYILYISMCLFNCAIFADTLSAKQLVAVIEQESNYVSNKPIDLSKLKGKWILINFWASWCEPCVTEIQEFNQLYAKHKDKIAVFAVNYESLNAQNQKNIAQQYNINYPVLLEKSTHKLQLGDIPVVPITYIFNPEGKLATKLYGGQKVANIEKVITDLAQR